MRFNPIYFILFISISLNISANEDEANDKSFRDKQVEQLKAIQAQFNKDASDLMNAFSDSDEEIEAQADCLDDLMATDVSIITVDPTSIWTSVYKQLRDEIMNRACTAAEDAANKHTEKISGMLETTGGLGSIKVEQGSQQNTNDDDPTDGLFNIDVEMTNDEAKAKVMKDIYGEDAEVRPEVRQFRAATLDKNIRDSRKGDKPESDPAKALRDKVNQGVLNIKGLFKNKESGKGDGDK